MIPPTRSASAVPAWLKAAPALFLLLWSSGFVFLKLGLAYADPLTFLALRYACVVALLVLPWLWVRPRLPATWAAWGHLAMVGLLLQAGYFSFTYLSLKYGLSSGAVALITSQQPILVGLLAPAIAGERVGRVRWIGLLLGASGAAMVIVATSSIDLSSRLALLFAVLALLVMTAGTLWEKRFGRDTHPLTANLVQYGVGLAVTAPLAWWLEPMRVQWTPALFGSLTYLVVANSIVAMTLLLAMVRHGEASRVSALFFLVPPTTALIAWAVLGETIPLAAWPGMAIAAAGLYLVMRRRA
ncbi:DMT family transporter [Cupriavidus gilardii]|uniref:DMT family transporter n=1 Tax=Cupriavidus gilardii TaxID=82541 RepID=UPI0021C086F6|nr:DMT family transporter [Cupriavidus gilardii]MCT9117443.1 DMT family transporter [Cupriavidus gilardii]